MYLQLTQLCDFVTLCMSLRALMRCYIYRVLLVVKRNASPVLLLRTAGVQNCISVLTTYTSSGTHRMGLRHSVKRSYGVNRRHRTQL